MWIQLFTKSYRFSYGENWVFEVCGFHGRNDDGGLSGLRRRVWVGSGSSLLQILPNLVVRLKMVHWPRDVAETWRKYWLLCIENCERHKNYMFVYYCVGPVWEWHQVIILFSHFVSDPNIISWDLLIKPTREKNNVSMISVISIRTQIFIWKNQQRGT